MMKIDPKMMHVGLAVVVAMILFVGVMAYMAGQQEGAAAAAAAMAATAEFWRRRGRQDQGMQDSIDRGAAAGEDIRALGADADTVVSKNREKTSASSGADKAKDIDKLTS